MIEIADAVVDDLTGQVCARCGTDRELTRPNSLVIDGVVFGLVVCTDCEHTGSVRLVTGARPKEMGQQ